MKIRHPYVSYLAQLLAAATLAVGGAASAESSPSLPAVLAKAEATKTQTLVMVGATWCGPCKAFMDEVVPHPEVAPVLAGFQFAHYNTDVDADAKALAKHYNITVLPTVLWLDAQGQERGRYAGGLSAAEFLTWLRLHGASLPTLASLQTAAKAQPTDARVQLQLGSELVRQGKRAQARPHFEQAAARSGTQREISEAATWALAAEATSHAAERQQDLLLLAHLRSYPQGMWAGRIITTLLHSPHLQPSELASVANVAYARSLHDASALNHLVYQLLERKLPRLALRAAQRTALLARTANHLDTLAEAYHANGNTPEALRAINAALALATQPAQTTELQRNRDRFRTTHDEAPAVIEGRATTTMLYEAYRHHFTNYARGNTELTRDLFQRTEANMRNRLQEACQMHAGEVDEAIVRIDAEPTAMPHRVGVFGADLSDALSTCLTTQAQALRIGQVHRPVNHVTLVVTFPQPR